jgi:aminoglycoside phosphotransferase family enzyme/predicted kinase
MITGDQSEVIDFLSRPSTHAGDAVEVVGTHASVVFLAGARAWKLKRAVKYDYLDFSTAERRKTLCEAEVRLNRRTAPSIYHRAVPVTREDDGSLAIDGSGAPVDWLVEMSRFSQDALLDRLASRGALTVELMRPLGAEIAAFHASAASSAAHGGADGLAAVIDGNAAAFAREAAGVLEPALAASVTAGARRLLDRCRGLLDRRRQDGFVRQCHGDLHLRNIVLLDGKPTLFDGIEFNDDLACIDVLYDLSFLLMDLWRRRLPRHANEVFNGYLSETGDLEGLPLLPLFLSCRAAIRAKTSATAAGLEQDAARRRDLEGLAREYLRMAQTLLEAAPPRLIAVGGLSGSGKSTLARALAPRVGAVPGAVVLRSDEIRKRMSGVPELTRLGPAGYSDQMSRRVYDVVIEQALAVTTGGHGAIADAVFAHPDDRRGVEQHAARAGVPFVGIWLDAPERVMLDRLASRTADVSDADTRILRMQLARGTGEIAWHRLDASRGAAEVQEQASTLLERVTARSSPRDARDSTDVR